jgi:hypothetical protein
MAISTWFVATSTAQPEEDPPEEYSVLYGLRTGPVVFVKELAL